MQKGQFYQVDCGDKRKRLRFLLYVEYHDSNYTLSDIWLEIDFKITVLYGAPCQIQFCIIAIEIEYVCLPVAIAGNATDFFFFSKQ